MSQSQAEQLAREIAREASFLSERWRLWLMGQLQKDLEAVDLTQRQDEQINQRMREAVEALERVARHLEISDAEALAGLTMRQFDAAPESTRKGWKARRVADVMRGSWNLAKSVAFGEERLPVVQERFREVREELARKRRESAFSLHGVEAWLATEPKAKTRASYEAWRKDHNRNQRAGLRPLPGQEAIRERWRLTWQEIVRAVEAGRVPGEQEEEDSANASEAQHRPGSRKQKRRYVLDADLRARRIREARAEKGLTLNQLAIQVGSNRSHLGKVERGAARQISFELAAKLAEALDLTLDDLATR